jgi:hypothetical protein
VVKRAPIVPLRVDLKSIDSPARMCVRSEETYERVQPMHTRPCMHTGTVWRRRLTSECSLYIYARICLRAE